MKIGVFDSGVGGQSVANAIQRNLPDHKIIYAQDRENVPYGLKTPEVLLELVVPILEELEREGCQLIVIACNTVTTTLIGELRSRLSVPLVGIEPMIKPAAGQTRSGVIAVCATPTTLNSARYKELIETHGRHLTILEPDCSDWAYMVEQNQVDHEILQKTINEVCERGADVIVLGCTHYHWIEEDIKQTAGKYSAKVIQPEQAVVGQVKRVLEQLG